LGLRESSPWAPLPNNTNHYHLFWRPPTSSGYDHRNIRSPIVFRLERHLLVILPLHASDAHRPSNGSRDLLLLHGVARCDSSDRDTSSTTDAGGPLDLHG
jgi:hypothetical protein